MRKRTLIGDDEGHLTVTAHIGLETMGDLFSADFYVYSRGESVDIGDVYAYDKALPIQGLEDAKQVHALLGKWIAEVEAAAQQWAASK